MTAAYIVCGVSAVLCTLAAVGNIIEYLEVGAVRARAGIGAIVTGVCALINVLMLLEMLSR